MNMLKGRCLPVVLTSLLLLSTVAEAKRPPLPQPDPARGSIGLTAQFIAPAGFKGATADQIYFVRLDDVKAPFGGKHLIRSNYYKKKQVYLLNAKPGRYVAVAARLRGAPGLKFDAFFSMETITTMEVTVVSGKLVFMGDFLLNTSYTRKRWRDADSAQVHYFRQILPDSAELGLTASRQATYMAALKSVAEGAERERQFWSLAQKKVFKNEPAWHEFVQKQLETLAK